MTLPAFAAERRAAAPWLMSEGACYRSVSPARGVLSSKPAARRCCFVDRRETDGRSTVSQTLLCILCGQRQYTVYIAAAYLGCY